MNEEEIRRFVLGYARGEIDDDEAAAVLREWYEHPLDPDQTVALTRAMIDSGRTLSREGISRPLVDKHSTGGVADGVTLVFAPLAASLGLGVAKLSGRGLGHTGGTLDKLEAIPGLRTDLSPEEIVRQVEEVGCAVAAQTADLVPADGKLYALRNETGTIDSVPLIAASVMSKKLAVDTDLVLLDVKVGSGAFMRTVEDGRALAEACVGLATAWGRDCGAAVTDMSQPLGEAIGNALDVAEAVEVLGGRRVDRLAELARVFTSAAGRALMGERPWEAEVDRVLSDGSALLTFARMVEAQGGDRRVAEEPWSVLPRAPVVVALSSPAEGFLAAVDAAELGRASGALGAGRTRKDESVDPAVGIVFRPKVGDRMEGDVPIGEVHARDAEAARAAAARVRGALTISPEPVDPPPLVHGWIP